ncbi:MAG: Uma2 family endonuclease [Cyanobacteria bacterium P01_A01_bin.114]
MTYTRPKPQTFADLLNYDDSSECRYELMINEDLREVPPETEENDYLATELYEALKAVVARRLIKTNSTTLEVRPFGDKSLNRYPDLVVLRPGHIGLMASIKKNAISLEMSAPQLVAEVVSPGNEKSENYQRDYVWKRQQYQTRGIPGYWIIDPHRAQVAVLILVDGVYKEAIYKADDRIQSRIFPALSLTAKQVLKR